MTAKRLLGLVLAVGVTMLAATGISVLLGEPLAESAPRDFLISIVVTLAGIGGAWWWARRT